jgi:Uncharacterized conserved protein
MEDIQNSPADLLIPIDHVGIKRVRVPLVITDRKGGSQHTVALVELGVDLPKDFKGTHMSRFVEILDDFSEHLSYASMKNLLVSMKEKLEATKARAVFSFPFFIRKNGPVSGIAALQGYDCLLTGELASERPDFSLEVCVPVMTVCPCSKAISDEGAHSQRAEVRLMIRLRGFNWLEEFIDIAESSASSPTFPLLKREDEKYVTETAFASPCFVEDVVRNVAARLGRHPQVEWFRVEVESYESIHAHNAFARIEQTNAAKG